MIEFERSYRTGRGVVGLVSIFGWLVAAVGLLVAALALVALLRSEDPTSAMAPITALAAGLGVALGGFVGVAAAQHMRATFDTADISRELLDLARKRPATAARGGLSAPVPDEPSMPQARPSAAPTLRGSGPVEPDLAAPPASQQPPAEPRLSAPVRAKAPGAPGRPIFSARPPR